MKRHETGFTAKGTKWEKLLDLAVLQMTGTLVMSPPSFSPSATNAEHYLTDQYKVADLT